MKMLILWFVIAFLVTIVYWAILSSPSTFSTSYSSTLLIFSGISLTHLREAWSNISVHALNTPFALFEILFTNTPPAPWITLPCGLLILAAYLGVAYITKEDQGFYRTFLPSHASPLPIKCAQLAAYNFLNPHTQHARLAGWIVGIGAAYCIIFVLVRVIVIIRVRLTARGVRGLFCRHAKSGDAEGEEREAEAIDEWVEVDSEGQNSGERV